MIYRIAGPFFFGASWRLNDAFDRVGYAPRTLILDLAEAPFVDATGAHALYEFIRSCRRKGTTVIISAVAPRHPPHAAAHGPAPRDRSVRFAPSLARALALVRRQSAA